MAAHDLVIGFDADDTLWHNENIFERSHERFRELLARHHDAATVDRTLFATEMRNLELYGYGVKGFTLSAIETAIHLTEGKISAAEIQEIVELGREMLAHPVELLDGAADILATLALRHRLLLITKGDIRDQERKLAKSELAAHFHQVEIVSEKNPETYARILRRHTIAPERFLMVGNSVKSDILPVLTLGGAGVHIPYRLLWEHERTEETADAVGRVFVIDSLRKLPGVVAVLA
ncbi:MAG: HAD family hydrolase [Opitutaceae bacterium]|nr:HAD family hydrolase [Opitutaceae bacterium]